GFSKLIIVTSSYHMPRTLAELGRVMPRAKLIPYPVVSRNFRTEPWWTHLATARLLFSEYVKFLMAAARHTPARLLAVSAGAGALPPRGPEGGGGRNSMSMMLRSRVYFVVFYVNTAAFLLLGSWLLLAPRHWAMQGLRLHGLASLWLLKMIC